MRYTKIPGGLALTFMCLSSCQSRFPSLPENTIPVELRTEQVQSAIIAHQGEFTALAIDFLTLDSLARPVSGAPVSLRVVQGPGEVAPKIALSDSVGHVRALYYAVVTHQEAHASILASVPDDSLYFDLAIIGQTTPASIEFIDPPNILSVQPGSKTTFQIRAAAIDAQAHPINDQPITFRIDGGASILRVSLPDSFGVVTLDCQHFGSDLSPLRIVAEIAPQIDVQPFAGYFRSEALAKRMSASSNRLISQTLTIPIKPLRELKLSFREDNTHRFCYSTLQRISLQASYESGEAAPGVRIQFESEPPHAIVSPTVITDRRGVAFTSLQIPATVNSLVITATALDFGVLTSYQINKLDPADICLEATPLATNPPSIDLHLFDTMGQDLVRLPTRLVVENKEGKILQTDASGRVVHRLNVGDVGKTLMFEVCLGADRTEWLRFGLESSPPDSNGATLIGRLRDVLVTNP